MPRKIDESARKREEGAHACARRILETVPLVMRVLRREMRGGIEEKLSVPQFRVLAFLNSTPGASLSELADFVGVADATASAMVERLVHRGLVLREGNPKERRRVMLRLSSKGSDLLERARAHTRQRVAGNIAALTEPELAAVMTGLDLLSRALGSSAEPRRQP